IRPARKILEAWLVFDSAQPPQGAEIEADEVIIIMKHQGPEIHLGEEAKDGVLGLMKSDDQGRTRGKEAELG
ncbi:hypothetical protein S83_008471, partial [Arachis hypogaea]